MGSPALAFVMISGREPAYYAGNSHGEWVEKTTPDRSN
jgi:hypothetical protein